MAFPTTDRHKILANSVSEQSYQIDRGLSIKDTTFHGVVVDWEHDSEFTYAWLKVAPWPPNDPDQKGNLDFLILDQDPSETVPDDSRYVKVYVLNLPLEAVASYYQIGQIITFWRYSGQTSQVQSVRGTYATLWVDHGQHIVHITSTSHGSGVYNAKRLMLVGTVGIRSNTDNLNMPFPNSVMPTFEDCLVVNLAENNVAGSHWIPLDTWTIGLTVAVTTPEIAVEETPAIAVYIPCPLTVGLYCQQGSEDPGCTVNVPTYTEISTTTKRIHFNQDDFDVFTPTDDGTNVCDSSAVFVESKPINWMKYIYGNPTAHLCDTKIIRINSGLPQEPPDATLVEPSSGNYDKYPVYFDVAGSTVANPCACTGSTETRNLADLAGYIYIPQPCSTPFTGTQTVVTSVDWNGSTGVLSKTQVTNTYAAGVLCSVSSPTTTTIDTATGCT